ncbi:MAG: hypothetical protein GY751_02910 [Bacteroidetes bacterium]|nr:hypothetical protein [Bacteroidota bacterium]
MLQTIKGHMGEYLFSTFDPVSAEQWKEKISTDLKGKDYDSMLLWNSPDGIGVKPFYNDADLEGLLNKYDKLPSTGPATSNDWTVISNVEVADPEQANLEAQEALMQGAGGINFDLKGGQASEQLVKQLVKGIRTDVAPVSITNYSGSTNPSSLFKDNEHVHVLDDILLKALRKGTYHQDQFWSEIWPAAKSGALAAEAYTVDGYVFKDAGANIVQELAYALGIANEYLNHGVESGKVRFRMAVSGNFFFEVAKLRALRRLWKVLSNQYVEAGLEMLLESRSSVINKSLLDQHTNMLRNTTECMASAIGGANDILVHPHIISSDESAESKRWARNILLILKQEAYLDNVADPAKGSYFVESVTDELCEAAWQLFKETEASGGFIEAWHKGDIKASINRSLLDKINELALRRSTLIGVNNYPNDGDKLTNEAEAPQESLELPPVRLAVEFERLRYAATLHIERSGRKPTACLLTYGKLAVKKARVNYASNLLGCAGISSEETEGDIAIEKEIDRINGSQYNMVVLCSDNDSWPALLKALKGRLNMPLVLAGDPAGLPDEIIDVPDHAFFMGCDVLKGLKDLQQSLFS